MSKSYSMLTSRGSGRADMCNRRQKWVDMAKSLFQSRPTNLLEAVVLHRGGKRWNMERSILHSGLSRKTDWWDPVDPLRGRNRWNMERSSSPNGPGRPGERKLCLSLFIILLDWDDGQAPSSTVIVCAVLSLVHLNFFDILSFNFLLLSCHIDLLITTKMHCKEKVFLSLGVVCVYDYYGYHLQYVARCLCVRSLKRKTAAVRMLSQHNFVSVRGTSAFSTANTSSFM